MRVFLLYFISSEVEASAKQGTPNEWFLEFISFIINSCKYIHEVFLFHLIVKKKKEKEKETNNTMNEQLSDMINSAVKFGS